MSEAISGNRDTSCPECRFAHPGYELVYGSGEGGLVPNTAESSIGFRALGLAVRSCRCAALAPMPDILTRQMCSDVERAAACLRTNSIVVTWLSAPSAASCTTSTSHK